MIRWFIVNQWKESVRSTIWNRNLVGNIILGFVVLMIMMDLVLLGLFIDVVLKQGNPDKNPVILFNGILLYYFGFDLLLRYLAQSLPTLSVESYPSSSNQEIGHCPLCRRQKPGARLQFPAFPYHHSFHDQGYGTCI